VDVGGSHPCFTSNVVHLGQDHVIWRDLARKKRHYQVSWDQCHTPAAQRCKYAMAHICTAARGGGIEPVSNQREQKAGADA